MLQKSSADSIPWVEKYRPHHLKNVVQDPKLIDMLTNTVKTGSLSHLLLYGPPGTGKTSAILAIGRELFKEHFATRVIEFNASDDRGINAVREKITNEAKKFVAEAKCLDGSTIPPYKIIILDEADSMTEEAQDALRVIIEQYSTVTRFCFICNYISRITDAIKSRCSSVHFKKLSREVMISKLEDIAKLEKMELQQTILESIIDVSNGDMRKAIMMLQNLRYIHNFRELVKKPFNEMTSREMNTASQIHNPSNLQKEITTNDVYMMAACITPTKSNWIIEQALECASIKELSKLTKETVSTGYPVDTILAQLNNSVLNTKKLTDNQKAMIILYSQKILIRMKECSNEYIQLLDYLVHVSGIKKECEYHTRLNYE